MRGTNHRGMMSSAEAVARVLGHCARQVVMTQRLGASPITTGRPTKQASNGQQAQHDLHSSVNERGGCSYHRTLPAPAMTILPKEGRSRMTQALLPSLNTSQPKTVTFMLVGHDHVRLHHSLTFGYLLTAESCMRDL
jgi:hypothetical protein